jgi:hypothetical protein
LQKGLGLRLFQTISQWPNGQQPQQCQQKTPLPMLIKMLSQKYFPAHQHLPVALAAFSYLSLNHRSDHFLGLRKPLQHRNRLRHSNET